MRIWVDADACPVAIKEILFRAAQRRRLQLTLVANQPIRTPPGPLIRSVQVPGGFDQADRWIVEQVAAGDLVVTADIPLAADVVARGAAALDPRGSLYTADNIGERVAVRDLMSELRDTGAVSGGPAALGKRERQAFANQLDRFLQQAQSD